MCVCFSRSFMPDSLRPHGLQPIRLLCLWYFPGKDTGVGCHVLLRLYTLLCSKAHKSAITCKRRHARDTAQQTCELTSATGHVSKRTFTPFEGLQLEGLHIGGFPGGSAGKESACNARDVGSIPGLGRSPWRRERLPTPVFWPGESHGL